MVRSSKKILKTQAARRAKKDLRELKQAKLTILEFDPNDEPNFDLPSPVKDDDSDDSVSGSESDEFKIDDDAWKSFVDFDVVHKNVLDLVDCSDEPQLHWIHGADAKFRALHNGSCPRTQRRKRAELSSLVESARGTSKISAFFTSSKATENYDDVEPTATSMTVEECLVNIEATKVASVSSNKKFNNSSNYDHLRYLSIQRYFQLLSIGKGKMEASAQACSFFGIERRDYLSQCIRRWAFYYMENGTLEIKRQGHHAKVKSLIYDEDIQQTARTLLRTMPRNSRTAQAFAHELSEKLPTLKISDRTDAQTRVFL